MIILLFLKNDENVLSLLKIDFFKYWTTIKPSWVPELKMKLIGSKAAVWAHDWRLGGEFRRTLEFWNALGFLMVLMVLMKLTKMLKIMMTIKKLMIFFKMTFSIFWNFFGFFFKTIISYDFFILIIMIFLKLNDKPFIIINALIWCIYLYIYFINQFDINQESAHAGELNAIEKKKGKS